MDGPLTCTPTQRPRRLYTYCIQDDRDFDFDQEMMTGWPGDVMDPLPQAHGTTTSAQRAEKERAQASQFSLNTFLVCMLTRTYT
jgi:hypothetical protein